MDAGRREQAIAAFGRDLAAGRRSFRRLVLPRADLSGWTLSQVDLGGAVLKGCRLDGAALDGATLVEADLRGASLSGALLAGADLRGADLRLADLRRANLKNADLLDADLRGADLRGATLDLAGFGLACSTFEGVRLDAADLRGLLNLLLLLDARDPEIARVLVALRGELQAAPPPAPGGA